MKSFQKNTALTVKKQRATAEKAALSSRAIAAQVLFGVLQEGKSLSTLLPEQQMKVSVQDFPLLQEICFGVCRVLPRLDRILQLRLDKPLKGKARLVHCLLLVGLYQLLYMRIPSHAAVDEMVSACKQLKLLSFSGLVNGVLRGFLREQSVILATVDKHWQTLHPEWLVNRLKKAYPHWRDIVEANNQKPPMWLRINAEKISATDYCELLREQGISTQFSSEPYPPQAICLEHAKTVNKLPHFAQGWLTVQDCNAQWAAMLLEAKNGEWILDACAAPGGKTTHILELAPQANVVALDVEAGRLKRVEENLERLQQRAWVICGDGTQPEQWLDTVANAQGVNEKSAVLFDRILLDAPCSATGVIRRHPDIKWLRQDTDIVELATLQQRILTALWPLLKPQGVLLYATCSLLPEENCQQIQRFLHNTLDARLMPLPFADGDFAEVGRQFFPMAQGGDGFYYAKLMKVEHCP